MDDICLGKFMLIQIKLGYFAIKFQTKEQFTMQTNKIEQAYTWNELENQKVRLQN